MTLPALDAEGFLPPARHQTDLAEIEAMFVASAPHSVERQLIWDGFTVWLRQVSAMLLAHRFWINGGFVTHKSYAPRDIDVIVLARESELDALPSEDQDLLDSLMTEHLLGGGRRQPMGGLVDAYTSLREDPNSAAYWHGWWSSIKERDGSVRKDARKGYLEVIA
jgi:hypothetical protein